MAWPIVIVTSGGLPVTEATNGLGRPVTVATNGFGSPATIVASGGLPVVGSGGGVDPLAAGPPGTLINQSANTDVTPTIRIPLNTAGGVLSNISGDVLHLYAAGVSVANATLNGTDVSNGYKDLTSTQQYGVSTSFTARSIRDGTHSSPLSSSLVVSYDYIGLIGYGQSNWLYHTSAASSPPSASEGTSAWDNTNSVWAAVPAANGIRELCNDVKSLTGKPVRLVWAGHQGVPIANLLEGAGTGYFEELASRIVASGIVAKFIVFHQGEGDAAVGTGTTAVYHPQLSTLHQSIVDEMGVSKANCPLIVSSIATTTAPEYDADDWGEMNRTLLLAETLLSNVYYSHSNMDAALGDGIHWTAVSYGRSGKRYARTIAAIRTDVSTRPRWFATAAARVDATHTDVTVVHAMGTDFTPTSAITGFEVSDDNGGTWEVPSAAVRQSAAAVRLTHSSMGTVERKVRDYWGRDVDVSGIMVDNGALAVPLNFVSAELLAEGEAALPVPTYLGGMAMSLPSAPDEEVTSGSTISIGDAAVDRMIIGTISLSSDGWDVSNYMSAIKIAPTGESDVAATIDVNRGLIVFHADVPAGTVAALKVTSPINLFGDNARVNLWSVPSDNLNSKTPVDTDYAGSSSGTSTTFSLDTSAAAGGFIIAVARSADYDTNPGTVTDDNGTFAGRATNVQAGATHIVADISNVSADADDDIVVTFAKTAEVKLAAAAWR